MFLGGLEHLRFVGSLTYATPPLHAVDMPEAIEEICDGARFPEQPSQKDITRVYHHAVHSRLHELTDITSTLWNAQSMLDEGIRLRPSGRILRQPITIDLAA